MMRLTEREQERVWELRAEGYSSRAIGRELGLRPQYVSVCGIDRWCSATGKEAIAALPDKDRA
jgi:hypothetical protein